MKLVLSRRATRRLREIADHIHRESPQSAPMVRRSIEQTFELLGRYPHSGRRVGRNVRRFAVPRLPYLIYYRVDDLAERITIITILHAAQFAAIHRT